MNTEQETSKEFLSLYITDVQKQILCLTTKFNIGIKIYLLYVKDNQHHNLELLK